jgi:ribonuclease HI
MLQIKDKEIIIFTDGSSRGNPGRGGYGVVAIYQNSHGEVLVDELGGREDLTTNNRMELMAIIEGIKNFLFYYENLSEYTFTIYTDSSYVLKGATEWLKGWQKSGWISSTKQDVKNRDLWEKFAELKEHGGKKGDRKGKLNLKWFLVKGHSGVAGNERCDVIATSFADKVEVNLYTGTLVNYQNSICEDILNIETDSISHGSTLSKSTGAKTASTVVSTYGKITSKVSGKSAKPFSYISLVDGQINVDKTWGECEKRVKGKSGAKYKKSISQKNQQDIIDNFLMGS